MFSAMTGIRYQSTGGTLFIMFIVRGRQMQCQSCGLNIVEDMQLQTSSVDFQNSHPNLDWVLVGFKIISVFLDPNGSDPDLAENGGSAEV